MESEKTPSESEVREQMAEFLRMAREVGGDCIDENIGRSIQDIADVVDSNLQEFFSLYPGVKSSLEARIAAAQAAIASDMAELDQLQQQLAKPVVATPAAPPRPPAMDPNWPEELRDELLTRYEFISPQRSAGESVSWTAWIDDAQRSVAAEKSEEAGLPRTPPLPPPLPPEDQFKSWSDWMTASQISEPDKGWDEFFR